MFWQYGGDYVHGFTPPSFRGISRSNGTILVISDAEIPIKFEFILSNLCPKCRHGFTGHITHAQIMPELVDMLERSRPLTPAVPLFRVDGDMSNCNTHVTCSNCFFTAYDDLLPMICDEMIPCDIMFDVINPNADVHVEWIVSDGGT